MATRTMKAITIASAGEPLTVSDLPIPSPGENELLVKPIYVAINPVDSIIAQSGLLVETWPLTPGCDLGGLVVEVGKGVTNWKVGDRLCGCTRVGVSRFAAFQEYVLVDADLMMKVSDGYGFAEAATVGVAIYTASLGVFQGLDIKDPEEDVSGRDEWALVMGGGSSVGKMGIQLLKIAGFKVVTTASTGSAEYLQSLGADAVVNYKQDQAQIISEISSLTNGNLSRVFDAIGQYNSFYIPMFEATNQGTKYFSTTNSFDPVPESAHKVYQVQLAPIGRAFATDLNAQMRELIPSFENWLANGKIQSLEYVEVGKGIEGVKEAYEYQLAGKAGGKKVVSKLQDE